MVVFGGGGGVDKAPAITAQARREEEGERGGCVVK